MSKRSRVGYTKTSAKAREGVQVEVYGKLYEVIDTVIPNIIIRQLYNIWNKSNLNKLEVSGSFNFIVERSENRKITGIRWGLDKNTLQGTRKAVNIIYNTITYHTHPGSSSINKELLFTIPSPSDLSVYILSYPQNQINLILDRQGIIVLDIDLTNMVKKIMERGMDLASYAAYVKSDFEQWYSTIHTNPGWYMVDDPDGYSYLRINTRADKTLVLNKLKQYGINSQFVSWNVESIPVKLDNIMTSEDVEKTTYIETSNSNYENRNKQRKTRLSAPHYWYYFENRNRNYVGPYSSLEILENYTVNKIKDNTLIREGLDKAPKPFKEYRKKILETASISSLQLKRIFDKHKNVLENINNNRLLNIWDNYDQYYGGLILEDRPESNNMSRAKLDEFRNAMNKILFSNK
jgi:hypothetical protein